MGRLAHRRLCEGNSYVEMCSKYAIMWWKINIWLLNAGQGASNMVNGLHLYSTLSSPQRPQSALHYNQNVIHPFIHTLTEVNYNVAKAALGRLTEVRLPHNRCHRAL
ncbi:hypothetical protein ILYODFUR_036127 [Ilyodon furcidens]|uniref:Uncharacterized protein n=1 Tax=Ilyodon furcidens TaxID=33524 RepID=A0ABV0THJ4_9TELE